VPKATEKLEKDEKSCSPSTPSRRDWVHLKTTNPIESTFATVRLRTKVTKGPGSRAAGSHGLQVDRVGSDPVASGQRTAPGRAGSCRCDIREGVMVERTDEQDERSPRSRSESHPQVLTISHVPPSGMPHLQIAPSKWDTEGVERCR